VTTPRHHRPEIENDAGADHRLYPGDFAADEHEILVDQLIQERDELRRSQTELELSRDYYVQLQDYAPVGYCTLDYSGLILAINATAAQILGKPVDRLVGWPLRSMISKFDQRKFVNHLRLCPGQKGCVTTELRLANGSSTWVELLSLAKTVEPLKARNGRDLEFKCVLIDITVRKRAEEALRESEERFRTLADSAPVLIWIAGPDRQCNFFNRRWLEFTGRTAEQEVGDGWMAGVHAEDLGRFWQIYTNAFNARKEFRTEYRLRHRDGEYRWILDCGIPHYGPGKDFRGFIGSCIDITDRKEMEKALEVAGRLPQENPSPVMRLDYGRILQFCNPASRRVLAQWGVAVGQEVPSSISRTAVRALSRNQKQTRDLAVGGRQFQVTFAPFREAGHVNLYFSDITSRKEAEAALRKAHRELEKRVRERTSELARANVILKAEIAGRKLADRALRGSQEKLSLLIESTKDYSIIMLDPKGRVASWNLGAELINGYRAQEIRGRHFSCFYPPADIRAKKPRRLLELAQTAGRVEDEGWRVRKDGTRYWASVLITALRDKSGRLRGYSKVTRDITERREVEEALRLSERNLVQFFNDSPFGLFWIAPRGKILRVNKAGQELLGLDPGERINQRIQDFLAEPKRAADMLKRMACGEEAQNDRARLRRKDGTVLHVLIDANGLWEHGRLLYSRWFVRDITRQLELEREVLVVAERERQRIGHELHDDLCQQLTGIEFLSQTLVGQLSGLSAANADRAREIAQMVRKAIDHTRELAHGLSPVQLETVGLNGALEELAARTRRLFRIDCRFRSNAHAWTHDPALGIHLYRIAQESISNALKHGRAKRVEIGLVRNKYRLVLAVSDNGVGLPTKPRKSQGTGLRVMQYRAGAIHGNLVVRRNLKGGTTVSCTIIDAFRNEKLNSTL
jgi:PAS domain S-box-containing protein